MTLSTTTNKATFAGSGTTGPFTFTFPFYDDADLAVYKVVSGVPTLLTITTDYTVSGAGETTGGSVTTVAEVAVGETLVVMRDLTLTQAVDLVNQGAFYADTLEEVFDRLTMFCQQLKEGLDRTIKLPIGSTTDTDSLADNMLIVASGEADIVTVADNIADVNTVADNIVDVGIVADNVVDVTNFADVYQGAKASDPATRNDSSALQAGDMYFNTGSKMLLVYDGADWVDSHAPVPFTVYEDDLDLSDVTTADVSTTEHGFCPKAPNDTAKFLRGDATWAALPAIVAVHSATRTTRQSITSVIPLDNTIPQNTEGTEVLTITFTPTSATNKLIFMLRVAWDLQAAAAVSAVMALFQDNTAGALDAAVLSYLTSGVLYGTSTPVFVMDAGTTSETTFKLRAGLSSNPGGNYLYINGNNSISPFFGGVCHTSITVLEVKA